MSKTINTITDLTTGEKYSIGGSGEEEVVEIDLSQIETPTWQDFINIYGTETGVIKKIKVITKYQGQIKNFYAYFNLYQYNPSQPGMVYYCGFSKDVLERDSLTFDKNIQYSNYVALYSNFDLSWLENKTIVNKEELDVIGKQLNPKTISVINMYPDSSWNLSVYDLMGDSNVDVWGFLKVQNRAGNTNIDMYYYVCTIRDNQFNFSATCLSPYNDMGKITCLISPSDKNSNIFASENLKVQKIVPFLPSDASEKTYALKAVNGTLTWVEE